MSELEELNELLREKIKKLESDLWDKEQLRQVYSEKSFNLDSKVRELEARNQKDFVWRGNEISRLNDEVDELKEKLEAAEKRNAEQREYYEGVIADGSKRIAELEKGHQEAAKQTNSWRRLAKLNIAERGKDISELEAARQRIAELEAKLETADKLQDSAFRDGLKAGFSYGQTDDQFGFAQCMSAYSTRAGIKVKGE
ncbi:ead/Ea22-like family protein [Salmonella enterica]|nr:ead/Ea22-like family protein [Salmonella enterica]EIJ9585496.1 ead/Ea22-like family protein [Salmonella enterica]EIW6806887.1 ead/Ea22-like family protein [Salmonella enterica]